MSRHAKSKLRRWRLKHGLTHREIGDLTGYDPSYIYRVEVGERRMAPMARVTFARRLGVEVSELFDVDPAEELEEAEA